MESSAGPPLPHPSTHQVQHPPSLHHKQTEPASQPASRWVRARRRYTCVRCRPGSPATVVQDSHRRRQLQCLCTAPLHLVPCFTPGRPSMRRLLLGCGRLSGGAHREQEALLLRSRLLLRAVAHGTARSCSRSQKPQQLGVFSVKEGASMWLCCCWLGRLGLCREGGGVPCPSACEQPAAGKPCMRACSRWGYHLRGRLLFGPGGLSGWPRGCSGWPQWLAARLSPALPSACRCCACWQAGQTQSGRAPTGWPAQPGGGGVLPRAADGGGALPWRACSPRRAGRRGESLQLKGAQMEGLLRARRRAGSGTAERLAAGEPPAARNGGLEASGRAILRRAAPQPAGAGAERRCTGTPGPPAGGRRLGSHSRRHAVAGGWGRTTGATRWQRPVRTSSPLSLDCF